VTNRRRAVGLLLRNTSGLSSSKLLHWLLLLGSLLLLLFVVVGQGIKSSPTVDIGKDGNYRVGDVVNPFLPISPARTNGQWKC
jgi:hypothetical protein